MRSGTRSRFWWEAVLAVLAGLTGVATLVAPRWIELVLRVDPDHGSGSAERAVVAVCALLLVVSAAAARVEWRRRAPRGAGAASV